MENSTNTFDISDFSFTYAGSIRPTLKDISFSVKYGEFILLCGKTGSGKSTLLRNFKTIIAPLGKIEGDIHFYGRNIRDISNEEQARRIGFVLQDPENQIVTDKVWHELAFGLENLGVETNSIRTRVAEMATFFGISPWINKEVKELSGGQKQLLNLASIMTMNPDILILDEPTSALDPIASEEFIETLIKINKDIGTTVIISEHDLNRVMSSSDRVIVLDKGRIAYDDVPRNIGNSLSVGNDGFLLSMPVPLQVYVNLKKSVNEENFADTVKVSQPPLTVREGRDWLTKLFENSTLIKEKVEDKVQEKVNKEIILKDIRFKYKRDGEDIIKNLRMDIEKNNITTIVGGNGAGKSTLLRIIAGILTPYKGKISPHKSKKVLLPQNPQTLFVGENVEKELWDVLNNNNENDMDYNTKRERIMEICELMNLREIYDRHPYDLSGGEQQRLAFGKVLLANGDIYLLDEPTSGLDGISKTHLGQIIRKLSQSGKTIVMVTHDLEFAAQNSDKCLLIFDGQIMSGGTPDKFFSGNTYYTTAGNRMSRHIFDGAVTPHDVADLCKINLEI